jgi:hypothetical protein
VFDIQLVADSTLVEMSSDTEVRAEFGSTLYIIQRDYEFLLFKVDHDAVECRIYLKCRCFVTNLKTSILHVLRYICIERDR